MGTRPTLVFSFAAVFAVLTTWRTSPLNAADKSAVPVPGHIDADVLKFLTQESRLNELARHYADLGIQLPPDKAFSFGNSFEVRDLAMRLAFGAEKRPDFMKKASALIEKRRKQVEQGLGAKMHDAEVLEETPQNQAERLLQYLDDAITQMHLPPSEQKARIMLGERQQKLFDEDARRRGPALPGRRKPPEHDAAWLSDFVKETEAALASALKPEYQRELIRVWPVLFPKGEFEAPAEQNAP